MSGVCKASSSSSGLLGQDLFPGDYRLEFYNKNETVVAYLYQGSSTLGTCSLDGLPIDSWRRETLPFLAKDRINQFLKRRGVSLTPERITPPPSDGGVGRRASSSSSSSSSRTASVFTRTRPSGMKRSYCRKTGKAEISLSFISPTESLEEGVPSLLEESVQLLLKRGQRLVKQSDFGAAEKIFRQALRFAKQIPRENQNLRLHLEATASQGLAKALIYLNQTEEAIRLLEDACGIVKKMKDSKTQAEDLCVLLRDMGDTYFLMGHFTKSQKCLEEGLKCAQQLKDEKHRFKMYKTLAQLHCRKKDLEQAKKYLEEAKKYLEEAKKRGSVDDQNLCYVEGMLCAEQGNWAEAISCYELLLGKTTERQFNLLVNSSLGYCCARAKHYPKAEECLKRGIAILDDVMKSCEEIHQVSYFEEYSRCYHMLIDVLIAQEKFEEALVVADRAKSIALTNQMKKEAWLFLEPPSSCEELQRIAKENDSSFIQYTFSFFEKNTVFIWFVPKEGDIVFERSQISPFEGLGDILSGEVFNRGSHKTIVPSRVASFKESFEEMLSLFSNFKIKDGLKEDLSRLYQELVQPVEGVFPQDPTDLVTIIPDHILHQVPFAVLRGAEGKYMIQNHTLASAPSCYSLDLLRERKGNEESSRGAPLLIGNPTGDLSGAESEAKKIHGLIGGERLSRRVATLKAVQERMPTAKIVHFASHGNQDALIGDDPQFAGGLKLANGYMCAENIPRMNAELVCMSACETGKGIVRYEGMMGLTRKFLSKGCDSVIATHWCVPDGITKRMMIRFYEEYQHQDKAHALRSAMLSVLDHELPQDWGAFFISGLSGPLAKEAERTPSRKRERSLGIDQKVQGKRQETSKNVGIPATTDDGSSDAFCTDDE